MIEKRAEVLAAAAATAAATEGGKSSSVAVSSSFSLGKVVPLSDVSGSMSGTPMMVSIGLGILCSELTHPAFRDLVLCFSGEAEWENLSGCHNFVDKVQKMKQAPWGGNTDFYKAMGRIAKVVEDNRLPAEEVPNLLVISDMQFDAASSESRKWNTAYENIEKLFADLGTRLHGAPMRPPTIIFWDVRGKVAFPASASQPGVVLLSGYSPALMKFVLSGDLEDREETVEMVDEATGEVRSATVKVAITPSEAMAKVLGEEAYAPVRAVLEGLRDRLVPRTKSLKRKYLDSEGSDDACDRR
jgi:hypothetical protein